MDIKRITSALLGFPLVVAIFLIGNKYIVDIALAIVTVLALDEYFNAVSKICKPVKWIGYVCCLGIAIIHVVPFESLKLVTTLVIPTILSILFVQIIVTNMKTTFKDVAFTFIGILYVVFFMMFVAFVYGMPNGNILIWIALIAAWGTDIFAYLIGRKFGKHKFSKVSPKKSVEGCIAGTLGALLMIIAFTYAVNTWLGMSFNYLYIGIVGIVLSLLGQLGDFVASSIKRYVDIKDYSNLIPGHGGMLDRIDSLIFLAPFAYAFFTLL